MEYKVHLRAGTPDDDNRTYLPEAIKGSDMVVNENGNNSQPYPERLKECRGILADGLEDVWYEYVPASYDPAKKTIEPYATDLSPDLQDTHILEAKDGILWSFGFKDLAWFDGKTWTRVNNPDNPPIR